MTTLPLTDPSALPVPPLRLRLWPLLHFYLSNIKVPLSNFGKSCLLENEPTAPAEARTGKTNKWLYNSPTQTVSVAKQETRPKEGRLTTRRASLPLLA